MLLQSLYKFAGEEGLIDDPDYEPKPVPWLIRVSERGKLLGIESTRYFEPAPNGKGKPREVPKVFPVPRSGGRSREDKPFFLCDKAEYVFGIELNEKGQQQATTERTKKRHSLFVEQLNKFFEKTGDEGIRAVINVLRDLDNDQQIISIPSGCKGGDLFAFIYNPDVDILISSRDKVRNYLNQIRRESEIDFKKTNQCLITGELCTPSRLFPLINKIPGASPSYIGLVSYNSGSFESYGWEKNANATISESAAEACATALKRLLDPRYQDPRNADSYLAKQNVKLSADTVVCYWAESTAGKDICAMLEGLVEANIEQVGAMYQGLWRGRKMEIADTSAFYALTLTGTQGRAVVRDWFQTTVKKVSENLANHFSDLDIVRNVPHAKEHKLPPQIPLSLLLKSLATEGKDKNIPAPYVSDLFNAALNGTLYPISFVQRALERARAEISIKQDRLKEYNRLARCDARAAIIKAVLNRKKRLFPNTVSYKELTISMDPTNMNTGYLLGRLMAVIERMQQCALKNVNASVIDRYFSAASATPGVVFPRLLKGMRYHARKAKDDPQDSKTAGWLENLTDGITSDIHEFPVHLNLIDQGMFVLGYHHQRNWLWSKKEDRDKASPDTDSVS